MANEKGAAKDADFILINILPDVCYTPKRKGKPVPYAIAHKMDQSQQCSPNVFFRGKPAYLHEQSYVDNVKGDEAGGGKGIVSGTHLEISRSIQKSKSVFVNGNHVVRTGDTTWMNLPKPASPMTRRPNGGASGLGRDLDQLISLSPTLTNDLMELKEDGWAIIKGTPGNGSSTNNIEKTITIDENILKTPENAVQVLSHEVGHATYDFVIDPTSKEAFVDAYLKNEGAAIMKNIEVQREILSAGGSDIGISGSSRNLPQYNNAYDVFLLTGDSDSAKQSIGQVLGAGEKTSTTGQVYSDYYGDWYDQYYKK